MAEAGGAQGGDRQKLCMQQFDARLRQQLKTLINDDLIEEHRRAPTGPHSDPLQRVLHYFRRASASGKYAIVAAKPFAEYRVVRLSGRRGEAPKLVGNATYASPDEAYHAVFLKRVDDLLAS